jgi:hypothetical protein
LEAGDVIVAGDFNIGPTLGHPEERAWLDQAYALWAQLGLVSV